MQLGGMDWPCDIQRVFQDRVLVTLVSTVAAAAATPEYSVGCRVPMWTRIGVKKGIRSSLQMHCCSASICRIFAYFTGCIPYIHMKYCSKCLMPTGGKIVCVYTVPFPGSICYMMKVRRRCHHSS